MKFQSKKHVKSKKNRNKIFSLFFQQGGPLPQKKIQKKFSIFYNFNMFSGSVFHADSEFYISFAKKVDLGGDKVQVPQEGQGQKIFFFS
jgi:hypothetical protein